VVVQDQVVSSPVLLSRPHAGFASAVSSAPSLLGTQAYTQVSEAPLQQHTQVA
jgi:hypothetical protein